MTKNEDFNWGIHGPWRENKETDTQWKDEVIKDTLYLAFQGSVSKKDWLQNFMFWKKAYKKQEFVWFAHAGFLKKWKSIEEDILQIVKASNVRCIRIIGFSQGAGISLLAKESLWYNFPEYRETTSALVCGCPRVFGFWNSKKLKERLENVEMFRSKGDLVGLAPPKLFGYVRLVKVTILERLYGVFEFVKNHMSYQGRLPE